MALLIYFGFLCGVDRTKKQQKAWLESFLVRTAIGWFTGQDALDRGLPKLKPYRTLNQNSEGCRVPVGKEARWSFPVNTVGSRQGLQITRAKSFSFCQPGLQQLARKRALSCKGRSQSKG